MLIICTPLLVVIFPCAWKRISMDLSVSLFVCTIVFFAKPSSSEQDDKEPVVFELQQPTPSPEADSVDRGESDLERRPRSSSAQSLPVTHIAPNNNCHKSLAKTLSDDDKPTLPSGNTSCSTEQLSQPKASWTRRLSVKMAGLSAPRSKLVHHSKSQSALPTVSNSSGFFSDQKTSKKSKTGKKAVR